jgi:two-component system, NtrC family, response regulator AtoC
MARSDMLSISQLAPGDALPPFDVIFGRSQEMLLARDKIERLKGTNVPVLIHGESGTGKEVVARALHCTSPWSGGPFVKVSCPAIPATLMESELFGYEKGAFTGAYGTKPGRVEMANFGTLFMDEIAELDPGLQAKLLQVLQDGQFCRIGGREDTRVEARIVCATNRDLLEEIQTGRFRADLFYRINVVNLHLPPLRQRREDIPSLVEYFFRAFCETFKRATAPPSLRLLNFMHQYSWPGNIRQLENVVKRYVIFGSEEAVTSDLAAQESSGALLKPEEGNGPIALKELTQRAVQELERRVILKTLQAHNWNRKRVARELKISYRALIYKIRNAGLKSDRASATPPHLLDAE